MKKVWRYVYSFPQNTRTWQSDRQTDTAWQHRSRLCIASRDNNCPILMKFGTLQQILNPITVTWPKIEIFKIQDGGNRFFGHNSSLDCPISAKFCMRKQNGMSARATWQKLQIFKIQNGGRPPFWKSLNRHISVKKRPILMKFGRQHQILYPITVTWPKIEIFKNSRWRRPPS